MLPTSDNQAYSTQDEAPTQGIDPQGGIESSIDKFIEQMNIAEEMEAEELDKIGSEAWDGYQDDLKSKQAWDDQVDQWVKLAAQVKENKNYPWPNASNVK